MRETNYPAIMERRKGRYFVSVAPIGVEADGKTAKDAIDKAQNRLHQKIAEYEDTKVIIPLPSDIPEELEPGQVVVLINVNMEQYRKRHGNRRIRKNVSIPQWLEAAARRQNLSFSQVLEEGLKQRLGIE